MTHEEAWKDLQERLSRAEEKLVDRLQGEDNRVEWERLVAKRAGVRLAIDYMRGYGL